MDYAELGILAFGILAFVYSLYQGYRSSTKELEDEVKELRSKIDTMKPMVDMFQNLLQQELPRMLREKERRHSDDDYIVLQEKFRKETATPEELLRLKQKLAARWLSNPEGEILSRLEIVGIDLRLKALGREDLIGK